MTEACAPPRDGEDAAAVIRRLESLSAYLASLERAVDAMRVARLDAAREDLLRNFGQRIARDIVTAQEEAATEACFWLREAIARLQAGGGAGQGAAK